MKQIKLFLSCTFFLCKISFTQVGHSITLGPDLGVPSKNLGKSKVSLVGSIEYQLKLKAPIGAQLHVGYNNFKDIFSDVVRFVPIRVGIVGYLFQDLIFVNVDGGISHFYSPTTDIKQNGFSLGAGAGYKIPLSNKQFVQLSAYYNLHNYRNVMFSQNYNYNWFNIRAAYGLSFGKEKNSNKED